jgi:hypothetical protein
MTSINDAAPLRTEADVLDRVRSLVGGAITNRQLWVMFVDGDDKQTPVIMPISDMPRYPHKELLGNLTEVIGGLRDQLRTDRGPGSVILTVERYGGDEVTAIDREWAAALAACCIRARTPLRGVFLSTRCGVRPLPG